MSIGKVSTNIKTITKFGVRDEKGGSFRYYALEIELTDGRIVKFDEDDIKEIKEILNNNIEKVL